MTNILNEEIRVIQQTMAHLRKAIPLAEDNGKRLRLKALYDECQVELEDRLKRCEDFKG